MNDDPAALSHLHDLALPPPIGPWPATIGWWILAAGVGLALIVLAVHLAMAWRRNAYRRAALRELERTETAGELAALLKRTALAAFPRAEVAGLTGTAWRDFLMRTGGTGLAAGLTDIALGARPADPALLRAARTEARAWIRRHRAPSC